MFRVSLDDAILGSTPLLQILITSHGSVDTFVVVVVVVFLYPTIQVELYFSYILLLLNLSQCCSLKDLYI